MVDNVQSSGAADIYAALNAKCESRFYCREVRGFGYAGSFPEAAGHADEESGSAEPDG